MTEFNGTTFMTTLKYKGRYWRVTAEEANKVLAVLGDIDGEEMPTQYFAPLVYFDPIKVMCRWYDEWYNDDEDDGGDLG